MIAVKRDMSFLDVDNNSSLKEEVLFNPRGAVRKGEAGSCSLKSEVEKGGRRTRNL